MIELTVSRINYVGKSSLERFSIEHTLVIAYVNTIFILGLSLSEMSSKGVSRTSSKWVSLAVSKRELVSFSFHIGYKKSSFICYS